MAVSKIIKFKMSEKCYRFKPDALESHAPEMPGVYEFVTFDLKQQPKVVYVGLSLNSSIRQDLMAHLLGKKEPTATDLFSRYPNMYFDFVTKADIEIPAEWKDIAGELIKKNEPEFNKTASVPSSGRHLKVQLIEDHNL
ncbi:MAG: hypothetical protein HY400_07270 [Elusimicrobia bacterium]|nr:hypothetical protein [Elusimicrobiota bacterium]